MRPSESISDRVRVDFMSLFCGFLSFFIQDFLRPNYDLKVTLTRAETDLEGRMRAP